MNPLKRYGLMTIGLIALSIGAVGIVVPLLPTTPLVILAALCFATSSERMYSWLTSSKTSENTLPITKTVQASQ